MWDAVRRLQPARKRLLFGAPSDQGQLAVIQRAGIRHLVIGHNTQSTWEPRRPDKILQDYPKLMLAAFAAWPGHSPGRACKVLIIGLGAGVIQRHLARFYPDVQQLTVEINPMIHDCAKRYFGMDPSLKVKIADGASYIQTKGQRFDVIFLDAFDGSYVPPAFMYQAFFQRAKERLLPKGILLTNFWEGSATQTAETALWLSAFERGFDIRNPKRRHGNRILVGGPGVPADFREFRKRAAWTLAAHGVLDLDVGRLLSRTTRVEDSDTTDTRL